MRGNRQDSEHDAVDESARWTARPIALRSGVTLQYVGGGDPDGVPVLFLHGFTDTWQAFAPVLSRLPESIHAFALTQRGHGDSDRPAQGYSSRDFAADAVSFLDEMGIERAVIVGHSLGAVIARRFACDYPDRTLGLVPVSWRGRPRPEVVEFIQNLSDPIDPVFVRSFVTASFARQPSAPDLDAMVRESLKVPARIWTSVVESAGLEDMPIQEARIDAPSLIIWGALDSTSTHGGQDALTASIVNARLLTYPESGHSPHREEPHRFAADLSAFILDTAITRP